MGAVTLRGVGLPHPGSWSWVSGIRTSGEPSSHGTKAILARSRGVQGQECGQPLGEVCGAQLTLVLKLCVDRFPNFQTAPSHPQCFPSEE